MIQDVLKLIFIAVAVMAFSGCDVWDTGEHPQVTAIKKIAKYADSNDTKGPDLKLYQRAGIKIDSEDINATNQYIRTLSSEDVDTQEEIQNVVDNIDAYTNVKPTAKISVQSNVVNVGELVLLDGIKSEDSDGEIVKYQWKEGNTLLKTGISYDAALSKGRHLIELIVTDDYNATGNDFISVVVKDADDNTTVAPRNNQAPIAKIEVKDNNGTNNGTIVLDGSKSSDSDGDIVKYKWKEGTKALQDTTESTYTVTGLSTGNHTITLYVTDNQGATGTAETEIDVK